MTCVFFSLRAPHGDGVRPNIVERREQAYLHLAITLNKRHAEIRLQTDRQHTCEFVKTP